jgi:hypothetical protein
MLKLFGYVELTIANLMRFWILCAAPLATREGVLRLLQSFAGFPQLCRVHWRLYGWGLSSDRADPICCGYGSSHSAVRDWSVIPVDTHLVKSSAA